MKTFRLLLVFALILLSAINYAQNVTLQVNGMVTDQQTAAPVANHLVAVTVYPDSINVFVPITDSVYTDQAGIYMVSLTVPYTPGTAVFLFAGTFDCHMNWIQKSIVYTNNQTTFTADFSICTNTLPSPCENNILLADIQGLTASFQGSVINGLSASYSWQMGDGTAATGPNPTHTYAQQGVYNVTLQTVTPDSCTYVSDYTLILMDSIPNGCDSYFVASPTANPYEISFAGYTQSPYYTNYTWDFGDGTTASGQNQLHTYCCLGTYSVTLTTTDSTGCYSVFVASVFPDSTGSMTLSGQVFAGNNPLNQGLVTLFGTNPAGYYYPAQTTSVNQMGFYSFSDVGTGTYIILAFPQPDSLGFVAQYLPTYYGDVIYWEEATPVTLGVPLNPYNINMVSYDSISGGPGSVSGQLLSSGKSMLTGNQELLLLDSYGMPVRITYTDSSGNFGFASLPFGQYKVYPIITGKTLIAAPFVLSATNPAAIVIMTIEGNTITGINKNLESALIKGIYPNPAIDQISIDINTNGKVEIKIIDVSGRLVISETRNAYVDESLITIPVNDLKPGLYFVSVQDKAGNISSFKMVKN